MPDPLSTLASLFLLEASAPPEGAALPLLRRHRSTRRQAPLAPGTSKALLGSKQTHERRRRREENMQQSGPYLHTCRAVENKNVRLLVEGLASGRD